MTDKKKEYTTFVTGRAPLSAAEFRTELRETSDIHSSFAWTKFLREGVNAHFNARTGTGVPSVEEYAEDPSLYWVQPSSSVGVDGSLRCPPEKRFVAIYSKKAWEYGYASFRTKLPTLTVDNQEVWMGFENDSATGSGIAAFCLRRLAGVTNLRAYCGGAFSPLDTGITSALPADYLTMRHVYTIMVTKHGSEFYIDNSLVAVAVTSPFLNFTSIAYPPYVILRVNRPFTPMITTLLEVRGEGVELILPLAPSQTRINDGDPLPPRCYTLYAAGTTTLLAGLTLAAGSTTSHPVPVFGYSSKTLLFRADGAGTLSIQVLTQTNNWREYDSLPVLANTLLSYIMTGDAALTRVVFTPTTPPVTITDAEMILA